MELRTGFLLSVVCFASVVASCGTTRGREGYGMSATPQRVSTSDALATLRQVLANYDNAFGDYPYFDIQVTQELVLWRYRTGGDDIITRCFHPAHVSGARVRSSLGNWFVHVILESDAAVCSSWTPVPGGYDRETIFFEVETELDAYRAQDAVESLR